MKRIGYFLFILQMVIYPALAAQDNLGASDTLEKIVIEEPVLLSCGSLSLPVRDEATKTVINTEKEYGEITTVDKVYANWQGHPCHNYKPPLIDFGQKTLIGYVTYASGCSREVKREAWRDDKNKKIRYAILTTEHGFCKPLEIFSNWIVVPKIPADYDITVEAKALRVEN